MKFALYFTLAAQEALTELKNSSHLQKHFKAVVKTLRYLSENPRHPSLQTHKYKSIKGPQGEEVFEAYAEQNTPAAYRVFFIYGPQRNTITIIAITPHP